MPRPGRLAALISIALAIPLVAALPATADDRDPLEPLPDDRLQQTLEAIVAETGVPSLAAAVVNGSGVVELAVHGVRQLDRATPVVPDDAYHIGSNTKAMTAALVGRMGQGDHGVTFDTTLTEVFGGDFALDPAYADVSLSDLLAHAGGTPGHRPEMDRADEDATLEDRRRALAQVVLEAPPEVAPRTTHHYSNTGYVIVGAALEAMTGESWETLMGREIFEPLGMASCGFGPPGTGHDAPLGHVDGEPVYADNDPLLGPAGTVHCSMGDWSSFIAAILAATAGDDRFLEPATVERLLMVRDEPVEQVPGAQAALGWLVFSGPDGPVYMHQGSNTLWYSQAVIVPDLDLAIVGAANEARTGESAVGSAFEAIAQLYPR